MAFIESPRFPEDISFGVSFGPEFSTSIAENQSGKEFANRNRVRGRCIGECSHALKTQTQLNTLLKFFRSMGGKFHKFRFKDWSDYQCDVADSLMMELTESETPNQYQMYKVYEAAIGFSEVRKISKPVVGQVQIFRTRSATTTDITGASSIDYTTGIVTVADHEVDDVYTWSGEFDVPCRFDTDRMAVNIQEFGAYSWGQIPIREVLL